MRRLPGEDQELGLALRLLDTVRAIISRLVESPEQFPAIVPGVRRALSVVVLAVIHLRRRPRTWRRRKR